MSAHDPNELQIAVLGRDSSPPGQAREIERLAPSVARFQSSRPLPVQSLPEKLSTSELPPRIYELPVLGLEDEELAPVGFDPQGALLLAGPPRAGLGDALWWLAESMRRAHPEVRRILISPRTTQLAKSPVWSRCFSGIEQVREALEGGVLGPVSEEAPEGRPGIAIFIDRLPEFDGTSAETAVADVTKQALRNGHLLVGAAEISAWAGYSPFVQDLKAGRRGFLLSPDVGDGDLLRVSLPSKTRAADFPPGRGYWVADGRFFKVQMPGANREPGRWG